MKELNFILPVSQMSRLQFLTGDFKGDETVWLPQNLGTMRFEALWAGSWEPCDRYLHMTHFADNRAAGACDSVHFMATYDLRKKQYVLHIFSSSAPDVEVLTGDFQDDALVLVSQPCETLFGVERHRLRLTPSAAGFDLFCERQELDEWVPYCECAYHTTDLATRTRPLREWPPKGFS